MADENALPDMGMDENELNTVRDICLERRPANTNNDSMNCANCGLPVWMRLAVNLARGWML